MRLWFWHVGPDVETLHLELKAVGCERLKAPDGEVNRLINGQRWIQRFSTDFGLECALEGAKLRGFRIVVLDITKLGIFQQVGCFKLINGVCAERWQCSMREAAQHAAA